MPSRRREYHVGCRAKKAAISFVACKPNTATRVKIPNAMRIRGYSQSEAADRALQMQVRREAEKIKGEAIPGPPAAPEAAAMSALLSLSLSTTANVGRVALAVIIPVPAAVPILSAAGVAALPSPPRKTQKTSHQEQIARQNERKRRAIQGQAHARATTLVVEERAKEKENRRTTAEVIEQVEGEFRAHIFPVMLSKPTINRHVVLNMIGTCPLARGYEEAMPHAAFELLVLAKESFIKIKQVNSEKITRNMLMIMFNKLCGVTSSEKRVKETMFERVMRTTNVSLNASVPELDRLSRSKNQPYHNQPLGTSLVDESGVGRKGGSVCGDKK
jgi:hypothetical protein